MTSLYITYLFLFTKEEAFNLAGMYRYSAVFWLGALAFAIACFADAVQKRESIRINSIGMVCCAVLVAVLIPLEQVGLDLQMGQKRTKTYGDITGFNSWEKQSAQRIKELIASETSEAKIFVLSCGDPMRYLVARYEFLPYSVNSWGKWSFFGTEEEWLSMLAEEEYDYVWIEYVDEDFERRCGTAFEGGVEVDILYRVVKDEQRVQLIPLFSHHDG